LFASTKDLQNRIVEAVTTSFYNPQCAGFLVRRSFNILVKLFHVNKHLKEDFALANKYHDNCKSDSFTA